MNAGRWFKAGKAIMDQFKRFETGQTMRLWTDNRNSHPGQTLKGPRAMGAWAVGQLCGPCSPPNWGHLLWPGCHPLSPTPKMGYSTLPPLMPQPLCMQSVQSGHLLRGAALHRACMQQAGRQGWEASAGSGQQLYK